MNWEIQSGEWKKRPFETSPSTKTVNATKDETVFADKDSYIKANLSSQER